MTEDILHVTEEPLPRLLNDLTIEECFKMWANKNLIDTIEENEQLRVRLEELSLREDKLVDVLKMYMEIGDGCSRGYVTQCYIEAKVTLKELNLEE